MRAKPLFVLLAWLPFAACGRSAPPTGAGSPATSRSTTASTPAATATKGGHTLHAHGIRIDVPPGMHLQQGLSNGYFGASGWNTLAGPDSHGIRVATLALDGSDHITTAELRIGVSSDAAAMSKCTDVPAGEGRPLPGAPLDGMPFTRFEADDAAMSHYRQVEAWRAVVHGQCVAIGLLVEGTRPDVYDPPAKAPFGQDQAKQALRKALDGIRFDPR